MPQHTLRRRALRLAVTVPCLVPVPGASPSKAQTSRTAAKPPVHWSLAAAPPAMHAGTSFQIVLYADIDPGWHLYALQEPDGGPIATEIGVSADDPVSLLRVDQQQPRHVADPQFNLRTAYFVQAAQFTLRLRADQSALPGAHTLHVLLRYQACDERVCLPPVREAVEAGIRILP